MESNNTFSLSGMHCEGCTTKVKEALETVRGVHDVSVSLEHHQVTIKGDSTVPHDVLADAVGLAGDYQLGPSVQREVDAAKAANENQNGNQPNESLYPLFLIVAFIFGTTVLIAISRHSFAVEPMMRHFMAGFFLVFSFFKLLDLPGFVSAYRGYDLLARKLPWWGWIYPFVELFLGIAYILALTPTIVNAFTLVLMLIGSIGVLKSLINRQAIRCACLGTALKLPMTKVTLVEDLAMAAMAAIMIVLGLK